MERHPDARPDLERCELCGDKSSDLWPAHVDLDLPSPADPSIGEETGFMFEICLSCTKRPALTSLLLILASGASVSRDLERKVAHDHAENHQH